MGSCVVTEMRSREEREITFSADSKILCNKNLGISKEQVELNEHRDESGLASMRSKVYYSKQYSQAGVGAKENYYSNSAGVKDSEDVDNPKVLKRQLCKDDIIVLTEEGCQSACNSSLQNFNQLSFQSTRNNTLTMGTNTQTSIPFTSAGMATSQSSSSLTCINPHFKNNSSFMSSSSSNNNGTNQSTSICINGIVQQTGHGRRGSLLFRQKSQSPSKSRRNSTTRRTSMTTIDLSRAPVIMLNNDTSSSNFHRLNSMEDIITLVNSKNADTNSIKQICDDYIERKKIECSINDYTSDEFYNCIQDLAVALFKSQLQDLGKYYLDKLVHHKKEITQKNLLKNLFEYQKKL